MDGMKLVVSKIRAAGMMGGFKIMISVKAEVPDDIRETLMENCPKEVLFEKPRMESGPGEALIFSTIERMMDKKSEFTVSSLLEGQSYTSGSPLDILAFQEIAEQSFEGLKAIATCLSELDQEVVLE